MINNYLQYGCGNSAPINWLNFDNSPTLIIQKVPILGKLLKPYLNNIFPANVKYGDILRGLPVKSNTFSGVYCSHTLEHMSLSDFRLAMHNTYNLLKPGGIFRCVVPDLEIAARTYLDKIDKTDATASIEFLEETMLGYKKRDRGIKALAVFVLGNSKHLWMWDQYSLMNEAKNIGFSKVRRCEFGDSIDKNFLEVEDENRFYRSIAIECIK